MNTSVKMLWFGGIVVACGFAVAAGIGLHHQVEDAKRDEAGIAAKEQSISARMDMVVNDARPVVGIRTEDLPLEIPVTIVVKSSRKKAASPEQAPIERSKKESPKIGGCHSSEWAPIAGNGVQVREICP